MKRKSFFKSLLGLAVAPMVAAKSAASLPTTNISLLDVDLMPNPVVMISEVAYTGQINHTVRIKPEWFIIRGDRLVDKNNNLFYVAHTCIYNKQDGAYNLISADGKYKHFQTGDLLALQNRKV